MTPDEKFVMYINSQIAIQLAILDPKMYDMLYDQAKTNYLAAVQNGEIERV